MLQAHDFDALFAEVHGAEPFPWQRRLMREIAENGAWPEVLGLPTGSGKTAAIDIAVFHLALEADKGPARRAPVRIAFVVDRRLVVDDAYERAKTLEHALRNPPGPVTARVVDALKQLSPDGPPLIARRLRGGIPREDDWARTPSQPTILCSTVDQVGSRLLFRGYGVSDSMKPVHAGLLGSDCLILLDEAHLAEPFRQTLEWVKVYQGDGWRERNIAPPWGVSLLTATPGTARSAFSLEEDDKQHPVLRRRLSAAKPARLIVAVKPKSAAEDEDDPATDLARRADALLAQLRKAREHFDDPANGVAVPAVAVVVNRVARAREVYKRLEHEHPDAESILLIGPARPVDRDGLAARLANVRTGADRTLDRPLIVVATQCLEAGVDIDLDALITEAAPLDALRQRFGRLNRAGRDITPFAAVVASKMDLRARNDDPVYGTAIKAAWEHLKAVEKQKGVVDFGLDAFDDDVPPDCLSPRAAAPVLLPAHLDLLSQTSPVPAADPEIALYLHGPNRQPDAVTVVWRADIEPASSTADADLSRLLKLVPPRTGEAVQLPLWAVRRWLMDRSRIDFDLADIAVGHEAGAAPPATDRGDMVFRWTGGDERSQWVAPGMLRPGDTIVVPARYGGVDASGWNPGSQDPATDVAASAARPFAGRRFAVRVAPGLLDGVVDDDALANALANAASRGWKDLRSALLDLALSDALREDLIALDDARRSRVVAYLDVYGTTDDGRPRGVVFVAPFGLKEREYVGNAATTEDDAEGSLPGLRIMLDRHGIDVADLAAAFATRAGLPAEVVSDLRLAGLLHDAGKADPRFQAWLHYGDPLGPDENSVLAKSDRPLPPTARSASGLPENWRHEALSVRMAQAGGLAQANDPDLVLWLIGVHHGYGRPLFPHCDPEDSKPRPLPAVYGLPSELPPGAGPQSLAFDWQGLDWPSLYERLKARYGVWQLARLEAILRLADHRASEQYTQKEVP